MTDSQVKELSNQQKARAIKNAFSTEDGKLALQILRIHFDVADPSAPAAGFDTNQTMYLDGTKAPFRTIQQVFDGLWSEADPIPNEELQP